MLKRLKKALSALFVGQVINTLSNVVLVPLFLVHWTTAIYGEWLALFSLAAYLSTLDFGMNMAVVNRLTQDYARGDLDDYRRSIDSATAYYFTIATVASLLIVVVAFVLPVPRWIGLHAIDSRHAVTILLLFAFQVIWAIPCGLLVGVFRTIGHLSRQLWWVNISRLATYVATGVALWEGGGVVTVAVVQFLVFAVGTPFVWCDVKRGFPTLLPGVRHADWRIVRSLFRPTFFFFVMMVAAALAQQGPILVVSATLGGLAVAVFATSRTLANFVRQIVGSLNIGIWPDLTGMQARQEYSKLRITHDLLVIVSTTGCIAVAAVLWFEGGDVLRVWTRARIGPDMVLFRLLLIQLVLQAPWLASSTLLSSTNSHRRLSWAYLASSIIGIAAAMVLVRRYGNPGIPAGLIIGEAIACYHFVVKDACRLIAEPYTIYARRLWLGLAGVSAVTFAAAKATHLIAAGPLYLRWCEVGAVTLAVASVASGVIWLTRESRSALFLRLRFRSPAASVAAAGVSPSVTIATPYE